MVNRKRSEATEQILVIDWCNMQTCCYPELELIFHVPNGGSRNKFEAANLKRQGVKAGVPDLFLPVPKDKYHGLFIEMKYGKNTTTDKQDEWLHKLSNKGYMCKVCNGADEAIKEIKHYLKIK